MKWPVSRERFEEAKARLLVAEELLIAQRQDADVILARAEARHDRELERLHKMYERVMETTAKVALYGTANPPAGQVEDRDPPPEARVARMVSDETVKRMADWLFDEYQKIGLPVTRADCVAEARSSLYAEEFVPSPALRDFMAAGIVATPPS